MTAADLIIKYLEQEGVEYIFGVPGGALEPFCGAINRSRQIELILTKHEQGAAFMADGYARVSGKIGVCCATTGPGSTNLITGLASAYADSIPVIVITAQVPTSVFGKGALQESTYAGINIVELFRYFTKFSAMAMIPHKMGEMVREALRSALCGRRGPVHINIPMDILMGEAGEDIVPHDKFIPKSKYSDRVNVKKAATLLLNAKTPAMFLGSGTLLSEDAAEEVYELAKILSIPVITTPKAKGVFPEDHHLSLGVFGLAGSPRAFAYLVDTGLEGKSGNQGPKTRSRKKEIGKNFKSDGSNSGDRSSKIDVLLAIGTSFNEWGTHAWDEGLKPNKALIQVDMDPLEFGKNYPCDLAVVGDAKVITHELIYESERQRKMLSLSEQEKIKRNAYLREENLRFFKKGIGKYNDEDKMVSDDVPLKPQRLMKDLRDSLPNDTIFFVDIGNNMAWAIHNLDIYKPRTFFAGLGFVSMGFGVAAAVGAKFAAPGQPVVAIVGDGGFLMNGMEVATAVNYNKQVIWVVENNSELGMVSHSRKMMDIPYNIGAEFETVDFVKIAEGLGAVGKKITKPGEINKKMMREIIESEKSTVLDVIIDKKEVPPLGSRIKAISEIQFQW